MTISDAARAQHDQLFGDRASTLARTDPEFVAYFDNFAFGELLADAADLDDGVDLHTRLLVQLAATLAAGGLAEFRVMAAAGLTNAGVSPVELKELVYHAVPYVGLARVFDYLNAVTTSSQPQGLNCHYPGRPPAPPRPGTSVASRCRNGSSAQAGSMRCTPTHRRTAGTSSGI